MKPSLNDKTGKPLNEKIETSALTAIQFEKSVAEFEDLVKRGLAKKRGNNLLSNS